MFKISHHRLSTRKILNQIKFDDIKIHSELGVIHKGHPGKKGRWGSAKNRHFRTETEGKSDAPGHPKAFFDFFSLFDVFFELSKKIVQSLWD